MTAHEAAGFEDLGLQGRPAFNEAYQQAKRAAPALDEDQLTVVLAALDDAASHIRERAAYCPDCQAHPADLCDGCADRLRRAEAYDALAGLLRGGQQS